MYCLRKTWDHICAVAGTFTNQLLPGKWLDNCELTVVDSTHVVDNLHDEQDCTWL